MQILLHGYTGKMGQMLLRKAAEMGSDFTICAKVSPDCPQSGTDGCYQTLDQYQGAAGKAQIVLGHFAYAFADDSTRNAGQGYFRVVHAKIFDA